MQLPDVNVLLYAFRPEYPRHGEYRAWLHELISGDQRYGISELVLSSVVRTLTNPQIFKAPEKTATALEYVEFLRNQPLGVVLAPGPRHWEIFARLVEAAGATGNLVADAYHAALAIEHGCEWITADRHFARFPGLRWRHPLQ